MGQLFHPYEPDQALLLPPSLRDWLPDDHPAHFISDTVDELDLSAFLRKYEEREDGRGQLAYHPGLMLKVLIYAYSIGLFSSRRIAAAIEEQVALRYLTAGNFPSHRTIARFRLDHLADFQTLFVEVVRIAQASGMVKLGTLAVDGTKLKANASKHKAMSYGRMKEEEKRLREEIKKITDLARRTDEAEDAEFGPDFRGDELPEELRRRKDRLATIRAAKKRLEAAQAEEDEKSGRGTSERGPKLKRENGVPQDKAQSNFTDPESRIMKSASGAFEQSYNAQIAVDDKAQIVVAATVSQKPKDMGLLIPVVNAVFENTNTIPARVLADTGYKNERDLAQLEELGIDGYVSVGREGKTARAPSAECPRSQAMLKKLATKRGRARYRKRKHIVEPVFGWVKRVLGFRAFSLRGLRKVAGEWALVCMALNLRRMAAKGVHL